MEPVTYINAALTIRTGALDSRLEELAEVITKRRAEIRVDTARELKPGTRVQFTYKTRPKYLQFAEGTVKRNLGAGKVEVDLDHKVWNPSGSRCWHTGIRTPADLVEEIVGS